MNGTKDQTSSMSRHQSAALAIILISYFMIVIDISIVITALPNVQRDLGLSNADLSWMQNAYLLAFGGLLLLGARAGDIFGRKRMFIAGLGVFTAASFGVGLSANLAMVIAARAAQGIGAAVLAPASLALLTTLFPEGPQRTKAIAYYAAAAGVGASVGLVAGGIIADLFSWRIGFLVNIPVGIGLIAAARPLIKETDRHSGTFDILGAFLSTLGMTTLVSGVISSSDRGWDSPLTLGLLSAGAVSLLLFVLAESRTANPVVPLGLFARRERAGAYAARFLYMGTMVAFWFFSTQLMQVVLGFSPMKAGLAFLPCTLPNFAAAMNIPRLAKRFGHRGALLIGMISSIAGIGLLGFVSENTGFWTGLVPALVLVGLGQGITISPLTTFGVAGVAPKEAGAAAGVVNAAHQLGGSLGLAVLVAVFSAGLPNGADRMLIAQGIAKAFVVGTGFLIAAMALIAFLILPQINERRPS